ncbi:hypothetical protein LXL04_030999 [Taraxacum kok-saghyz]
MRFESENCVTKVLFVSHLTKEYTRKHACVDLTGVSPLVDLRSEDFTIGQAALKAASCKVMKHEKACIENQHVFIPFAFDTFGFLAPKAVDLLNRRENMTLDIDRIITKEG